MSQLRNKNAVGTQKSMTIHGAFANDGAFAFQRLSSHIGELRLQGPEHHSAADTLRMGALAKWGESFTPATLDSLYAAVATTALNEDGKFPSVEELRKRVPDLSYSGAPDALIRDLRELAVVGTKGATYTHVPHWLDPGTELTPAALRNVNALLQAGFEMDVKNPLGSMSLHGDELVWASEGQYYIISADNNGALVIEEAEPYMAPSSWYNQMTGRREEGDPVAKGTRRSEDGTVMRKEGTDPISYADPSKNVDIVKELTAQIADAKVSRMLSDYLQPPFDWAQHKFDFQYHPDGASIVITPDGEEDSVEVQLDHATGEMVFAPGTDPVRGAELLETFTKNARLPGDVAMGQSSLQERTQALARVLRVADDKARYLPGLESQRYDDRTAKYREPGPATEAYNDMSARFAAMRRRTSSNVEMEVINEQHFTGLRKFVVANVTHPGTREKTTIGYVDGTMVIKHAGKSYQGEAARAFAQSSPTIGHIADSVFDARDEFQAVSEAATRGLVHAMPSARAERVDGGPVLRSGKTKIAA